MPSAPKPCPRGCQLVWWWHWPYLLPWKWFQWLGPYPYHDKNKGCVYRWRVRIGVLEIRRWNTRQREGGDDDA